MTTVHELASALDSGELTFDTLAEAFALHVLRLTRDRHAEASEGPDDLPDVSSIKEGASDFILNYMDLENSASEFCDKIDPVNYMIIE